jgi:hypothetical protein
VLEPALGLTLQNKGTDGWEPEHGEAPFSAISDLANLDSGERVDWVVGFLQSVPKAPQSAEPSAPPEKEVPLPLAGLTASDRAKYDAARALEAKGDAQKAWAEAQSLFEAHPRVLEVQELRCRLAKARRLFSVVIDAHCERFVALSGGSDRQSP